MKRLLGLIRSHPARSYLALFALMVVPALALYPLAESGNRPGMGFALVLIILANAAALFL